MLVQLPIGQTLCLLLLTNRPLTPDILPVIQLIHQSKQSHRLKHIRNRIILVHLVIDKTPEKIMLILIRHQSRSRLTRPVHILRPVRILREKQIIRLLKDIPITRQKKNLIHIFLHTIIMYKRTIPSYKQTAINVAILILHRKSIKTIVNVVSNKPPVRTAHYKRHIKSTIKNRILVNTWIKKTSKTISNSHVPVTMRIVPNMNHRTRLQIKVCPNQFKQIPASLILTILAGNIKPLISCKATIFKHLRQNSRRQIHIRNNNNAFTHLMQSLPHFKHKRIRIAKRKFCLLLNSLTNFGRNTNILLEIIVDVGKSNLHMTIFGIAFHAGIPLSPRTNISKIKDSQLLSNHTEQIYRKRKRTENQRIKNIKRNHIIL